MPRLVEVALLFLRLSLTAFGGPAAHIALIENECVRRRHWLTREQFLDLLGAANLIPGPTSTELAMHVGLRRAGWPGLIVAGLCFIVPASLVVAAVAVAYAQAGHLPAFDGLVHLLARVRRLFDLDADPTVIDTALARDRMLRPLVRARRGVRVPGAIDPFALKVAKETGLAVEEPLAVPLELWAT